MKLSVLAAIAAIWLAAFGGWFFGQSGNVNLAQTTELDFELRGGFAYVSSPQENMLEVAYLKPTNVEGCVVPQPGTDLNVLRGIIVEPATNPVENRTFDVGGAVITMDAPEDTGGPITTKPNHPPTPNRPGDSNSDVDWSDTRWIPYVGPDFPTSSLNPGWRGLVDGRLVLKGGRLTGSSPSRVAARELMWEWRTADGDTPYQQAISDTARYKARIRGDRIVLTLSGQKAGISKIVLRPAGTGEPVVLQLNGRHDMASSSPIPVGGKVEHFCAFYQLMQPVPPVGKQYMPYLLATVSAAAPAGAGGSGGQASPGYYCPGNFY